MLSEVISGTHIIPLGVRELPLDRVAVPALLVQQRGRHAAKAVAGHLVLRVPQATQRCVDGVFAHRTAVGPYAGKDVLLVAGERVQILKHRDRLFGERHDMLLARLHARGGNTPFGAVQIELHPLGFAKLARPHEHERREAQRAFCDERPAVAVDRTHQLADPLGIGDRGMVALFHGGERAAQVGGRIAFRSARGDGVAKHLAAVLLRAVRGFDGAAAFDTAQCGEQIRRGDFGDGPAAEPRKDVALQPPDDLVGVARRPVRRIFRKPLPCDDFEAVLAADGERRLHRLAMFTRIDVGRELLAGFVAPIARILERNVRVSPERQQLFLAEVSLLEPPPARAVGIDQQVQTTAVEQLQRLVDGARVLDGGGGERRFWG